MEGLSTVIVLRTICLAFVQTNSKKL